MALFEGKTPAERNKIIAAAVFGLVALFLVGRMFFGSSGTTTGTNANRRQAAQRPAAPGAAAAQSADEQIKLPPREVVFNPISYSGGDAGRNIFTFAERPAAAPTGPKPVETPPPTPTPTPPLNLAALSPQSVYAQTGEFKLQVSGDKFTPEVRVHVDGQEVTTQFAGPQQLAATVPAALITAPGVRQIAVRTPDGQLYSNAATLNVMQPPVPAYTFIGYISPQRGAGEKALLKDQKNELLSVQVNDIVGGRFRVTGISARTVDFVDKDLKIKHSLPYLIAGQPGGSVPRGPIQPAPPSDEDVSGDEEP